MLEKAGAVLGRYTNVTIRISSYSHNLYYKYVQDETKGTGEKYWTQRVYYITKKKSLILWFVCCAKRSRGKIVDHYTIIVIQI